MRLRNNKVARLVDEQNVGATRLFNIGAALGIEVQVLGIASCVGLDTGLDAHGVVQAGLDVAGAMRSSAVILGDAQGNSRVAALEVRADRRDQNAELVLGGRGNANDDTRGDHERTDVQRGARAERRNPSGVRLNDFLNGLYELVLRERGHAQALGGIAHALGVQVGTEADDVAVLGSVCLQALEDLLTVMENARALGQLDGMIGGQAALFPFAVLEITDVAVIGGHVIEAQVTPVEIFLLQRNHLPLTRIAADHHSE